MKGSVSSRAALVNGPELRRLRQNEILGRAAHLPVHFMTPNFFFSFPLLKESRGSPSLLVWGLVQVNAATLNPFFLIPFLLQNPTKLPYSYIKAKHASLAPLFISVYNQPFA